MSWISGWIERAKRKAAEKAIGFIEDGWVVGLGSGSTVAYVVSELGRRVAEEGLNISVVSSSYHTLFAAVENKLPVTTLEKHPALNMTIDGADEIDRRLNLVKGGGAALTREKVVGFAAEEYVVIADETKLVERLGSSKPVPVEVLPFALPVVAKAIGRLWKKFKVREGKGKVGPTITDNGNFIIDIYCDEIQSPEEMDSKLKSIPGVVETGLFIQMAHTAYIGAKSGSVRKIIRS